MNTGERSVLETSEIRLEHSVVLFCDKEGRGLHFHVKPCVNREAVIMLIQHGGGIVVEEPMNHSITLGLPDADDSEDFGEEMYSTKYIEDCCAENKILDLKPYRMNIESELPDSIDVLDILLKNTTWSEALKGEPRERCRTPDEEVFNDNTDEDSIITVASPDPTSADERSCCSPTERPESEIQKKHPKKPRRRIITMSSSSDDDSFHDDVQENVKETECTKTTNAEKRRETMITDDDREYDLQNKQRSKAKSTKESGDTMWRVVDVAKAKKSASSKTTRKKETDATRMDTEDDDSDVESECSRKKPSSSRAETLRKRQDNDPKRLKGKSKKESDARQRVEVSESMDIDDSDDESDHSRMQPSTSRAKPSQKRQSRYPERCRGTKVEDSDSDSNFFDIAVSDYRSSSVRSRKRREYTEEERIRMVKYVNKQRAYGMVKGREFWQFMEKRNVVPGRTWQSLKEHFIKKVIPKIDSYDLTDDEIRHFRKPFQ